MPCTIPHFHESESTTSLSFSGFTMSNAHGEYDKQDTTTTDDRPQGGDTVDDTYASRPDQKHIPVIKDETPVEQPNDALNPDSDEGLGTLSAVSLTLGQPLC
jgi:hypothetical protein